MYCIKCGCKIEDTDLFCTECGNKVESNESEERIIKGKNRKLYVIGILGIALVGILIGLFVSKSMKKDDHVEGASYINNQIVTDDETTESENGTKSEVGEILTQEIRNYLLQKSDEYGQKRSNYENLSVEPVIVEGYLEKKDKSKDATMEENDTEYYYITLEKTMNIAYESYLDECILEESMDTVKLDATNLDSLCGKKVYCCGKVIDPGVASSGIHMMTAAVIAVDDKNIVSEDIIVNVSLDFVPDCSKENYNKVGNTFSNLLEGGYVTSQGEWMYYVRGGWGSLAAGHQEICKEPIEGGTPIVIYTGDDKCYKYF